MQIKESYLNKKYIFAINISIYLYLRVEIGGIQWNSLRTLPWNYIHQKKSYYKLIEIEIAIIVIVKKTNVSYDE